MSAEQLNQNPALRLDSAALDATLTASGLDAAALRQTHPHLFAVAPVFVDAAQIDEMRGLISAIEQVIATPVFQTAALANAPEIARHNPGYPGVCMGYDFHLTPAGARLIEINTNAGGLLLNAELARAQGNADARADVFAMFHTAYGAGKKPTRLAIVDTEPERQYLAPEFELFRRLFVAAGVAAFTADPREFIWDGEVLRHAGEPVDMVYNRLTDFSLSAPEHAALNAAYRAGAIVLTPHPRAHALYADKRNLCLLSDPDWLAQAEISIDLQNTLLAGIPRACEVTPENAAHFWQTRKEWFFKPAAGFGGRAAYRGDKLTRKVFDSIRAGGEGGYVAQRFAPPSTRRARVEGEAEDRLLKLDIRAYVFEGRAQLFAARLYQGQTTNFRTPGGGFAAVLAVE